RQLLFSHENRLAKLNHQQFSSNDVTFSYLQDGNPDGPVIVTLHDVGQDPFVAFGEYFSTLLADPILKEFCIYHISLPGQCSFDEIMSSYPSFKSISEAIIAFIINLNKTHIIGFGIGAGGNILIRCSLLEKKVFSRLILINAYANSMGWGEDPSYESYRHYLMGIKNWTNLRLLMESFSMRSPINLFKPDDITLNLDHNYHLNAKSIITTHVLLIISENVPQYDDCLALEDLIHPSLIEYIEFKQAHGFVLNQLPSRITHAIFLFIQGMGYLRGVKMPVYQDVEWETFSKQS
ncbi:hypothetical protein MXB_283, partial [Myxobolus squamalis]